MKNKVSNLINALYGLLCVAISVGLSFLALYWMVLQESPLHIDTRDPRSYQVVHPGSLVYMQNPVQSDYALNSVYSAKITSVSTGVVYRLPTMDSQEMLRLSDSYDFFFGAKKDTHPLYPVYIPTYLPPGRYEYEMTVSYRLNPFKYVSTPLPKVTLLVNENKGN